MLIVTAHDKFKVRVISSELHGKGVDPVTGLVVAPNSISIQPAALAARIAEAANAGRSTFGLSRTGQGLNLKAEPVVTEADVKKGVITRGVWGAILTGCPPSTEEQHQIARNAKK
jgi:uncharacterized protein YwbE